MKKTMRFISALLSSLLICGAVAVSADDTAASETTAEEPVATEVTEEAEAADEPKLGRRHGPSAKANRAGAERMGQLF